MLSMTHTARRAIASRCKISREISSRPVLIGSKLRDLILSRSNDRIKSNRIATPFSSSSTSENDVSRSSVGKQQQQQQQRVKITNLSDGIVKVELSRPDKMNGLDMPMFEAIAQTAITLREDKSVRVIILSGEGRAFCTGLDLKSIFTQGNPMKNMERLLERSSDDETEFDSSSSVVGNLAQNVAYLWRSLSVPVIAVLHGMCFGGGTQIALGADMRFSTPDCRISIMEAKWGLIPDMSGSVTLRELVRIDVAKELTMTGRVILGTEAAELGLVTRVVDNPMEEAMKVAKEITLRSPDSVSATKHLFQETWVAEEGRCLEVETKLQRQLIGSWNQVAASTRNFAFPLPYLKRKEIEVDRPDDE